MIKMALISEMTAGDMQSIGDIVRIIEETDKVCLIEHKLFTFQFVTNVTCEEVEEYLMSRLAEGSLYSRYPFSIVGLTEQQKKDLEDSNVNHDDTMAIIRLLTIKDPL